MMNIKRNMFAVLAAAVLPASCSQDEVMTASPDGLVPVTLSATVGDGVQTRAATEGEAKRCVIQILEKNRDGWSDAIGLGLEKNPIDMEPDVNNPAQFTLTGVLLNPDKEYTFLFWADEGKDFYDASDLENVKIVNDNATNIAWQGKATWDKTEGSTITAELTHAVAKVTLQSTEAVESGRKFVLSNLTEYNGFDVLAGTANGDIVTPGHEGTGTGASGDLLSFYALVTDENQELKLTSGEGGGVVSIPNVPLAPNTHVILEGDVQNAGWTTVNFTTSVETTWSSTPIEIIGLEIADGGTRYIVSSPAALQAWATEMRNDPAQNLNCTLAADIDLTGQDWTPIPGYAGTFDGDGNTITGLTINQSTGSNVGLFASIESGGTVKDLKLDDVNITAGSNVGAIAGENRGTIENCSVSGSVTGNGLDVSYVGGITGKNQGTITGCATMGSVKVANGTYVGGIVGWHGDGTITDCHSSATVEGIAYIGGVVGQSNDIITACYSTGNVTAKKNNTNCSFAGGVVGLNSDGAILTACYATGDVEGGGEYVGGVVGDNSSTVTACYHATGNVTGATESTGGVAGRNYSSSILMTCYWDGTVTGNKGIGYDMTNFSEAQEVDGDWKEAVLNMNSVLADYYWEWTIVSPNTLPTLKKKETN